MTKPLFIKVENYKEILDIVDVIKGRIAQAKAALAEIKELKQKEDEEIREWASSVEDMESKVGSMSRSLFDQDL
ncbi:hypothetical protein JW868_04810 [Candidatus Woesearchaeota archaeon]|nr:hypothetical protein [Candidatus Woesearchaeota archaeon]